MKTFLSLLSLLTCVAAVGRTSPPAGCLVVAKASRCSQFQNISAALATLSTTSKDEQCIFIYPGNYTEQVYVTRRSAKLTFYGFTLDTSSYHSNQVTISNHKSQADGLSNDMSGTLRAWASNFSMYNINVENTHGPGSQAVALSAKGTAGYYGCSFTGYQDTLLSDSGNQTYVKSLVTGVIDFIFGQNSMTWFEKCDINVLQSSGGWCTAQGRPQNSGPGYYVFNNCNVSAAPGQTVPDGAFYLGRPWGTFAQVVWQNSWLGPVINHAGWAAWSASDPTAGVFFGEHNNSGPGAVGPRVNFSRELAAPITPQFMLGNYYESANWFDADYFGS